MARKAIVVWVIAADIEGEISNESEEDWITFALDMFAKIF
jgi:hypothetical protein